MGGRLSRLAVVSSASWDVAGLLAPVSGLPVVATPCLGATGKLGGKLGRLARGTKGLAAALRVASSARPTDSAGSMPLSADDGGCEPAAPPYSDLQRDDSQHRTEELVDGRRELHYGWTLNLLYKHAHVASQSAQAQTSQAAAGDDACDITAEKIDIVMRAGMVRRCSSTIHISACCARARVQVRTSRSNCRTWRRRCLPSCPRSLCLPSNHTELRTACC